MIYPLFRCGIEKVYSSAGLSRFGHSSHTGNDQPPGSLPLKSSLSKPARRGKLRSVNALPSTWHDDDGGGGGEQGWDSKERIIIEEQGEIRGAKGDGASSSASGAGVAGLGGIDEEEGEVARVETQTTATGGGRDRSMSRTRTHSRAPSAVGGNANGLRSARASMRGSVSGVSASLGGIKVTKETDIRTEERTIGESTRTPSPPNDTQVEGFLDVNGAVEVMGRSESRFKYREDDGLEYTAYVGRGI